MDDQQRSSCGSATRCLWATSAVPYRNHRGGLKSTSGRTTKNRTRPQSAEARPNPIARTRGFALAAQFLLVGWLFLASSVARGDTVETFEGPDPTWTLAESDCQAQAVVHQRRLQDAHSGQGCEFFRIIHGQGSSIYLTHRIDPSPVIAEWSPSVWIKSDQPGIQLLARVVLPRTLDPRTGKPLTTFLFGDSYRDVTLWQQLGIPKPVLGLERQVRALRSQWGPKIDIRQAYVDLLVLNAYAGTHSTHLWIDDLEVRGHVEVRVAATAVPFSTRAGSDVLDRVGGVGGVRRISTSTNDWDSSSYDLRSTGDSYPTQPASHQTPAMGSRGPGDRSTQIRLQGAILTVVDRPLLPRIVRWSGEPFDWLHDLGFNALILPQWPTAEQVAEARRLDLWLIVPPPREVDLQEDRATNTPSGFSRTVGESPIDAANASLLAATAEANSTPNAAVNTGLNTSLNSGIEPASGAVEVVDAEDRILAWNVGTEHLVPQEVVARRMAWVRSLPLARRRPIFGAATDDLNRWSRMVDVLAAPLWNSAVTSGMRKGDEPLVTRESATQGFSDLRPGVPLWAEIPLPRLPELLPVSEHKYAEGDLIGIRWRLYQAVSDGARGFVFQAPDSLEPGRAELKPLLTAVRTLNAELALLEPWIAVSQGVDAASPSDPRYQVRVLSNDRGRLAIVLRDQDTGEVQRGKKRGSRSQPSDPLAGSPLAPGLTFVDQGAASGLEAYEITPSGLRPLRRKRVAGGVAVTLDAQPAFALVVLTQQPIVINYLARRLASGRGSPAFR
jgi:hypothetical protein